MIVGAKNVIVVSDLHLGHKRANRYAFSDFLTWVETLNSPKSYHLSENFSKELAYPDKIIFLGDIFELYDPENGETDNVTEDALPILEKLSKMSCEKVYITGNHDESLKILDGLEIKKSRMKAYKRHYPPHADADVMRIGDTEYFFLHGHQYDKKIERIGKWGIEGPYNIFQLQEISRSIFGLEGWGSVILAGVLSLLYVICTLLHPENSLLKGLFLYPFLITAPFWGSQVVWRTIAPLVRKVLKSKDKNIQALLENDYYRPEKDTISADFLVFGHTHFPGICEKNDVKNILEKKNPLPREWKCKGLLNTGGWFGEQETPYNTFLYIDADHVALLTWNPQEERPELVDDTSYIELNQS